MALLRQEAPEKITGSGGTYRHSPSSILNVGATQYSAGTGEGQQLRDAIEEYGNAIRQLAANIFPGDMLFKNFGVTRHGRVVFYDYDEI